MENDNERQEEREQEEKGEYKYHNSKFQVPTKPAFFPNNFPFLIGSTENRKEISRSEFYISFVLRVES